MQTMIKICQMPEITFHYYHFINKQDGCVRANHATQELIRSVLNFSYFCLTSMKWNELSGLPSQILSRDRNYFFLIFQLTASEDNAKIRVLVLSCVYTFLKHIFMTVTFMITRSKECQTIFFRFMIRFVKI